MEPVTHLAAGLLTAQALRRRLAPARGLAALCAVAATIPDIDGLAGWFGPEAYLLNHRGLTHSVFALPVLALFLAWAAKRLGATLTLRQGVLAAGLALATHLFLDVVTAFGTQLFAPFSHRRVSFEGLYIVDPAFTLALLGFALAARLKPERRQAIALVGLGLMLGYPLLGNALRLSMQSRYETLLERQGRAWERLSLTPDALAPFYWKVVQYTPEGELLATTADPLDIARPYPVLRLRPVDRALLLRLGESAAFFRTYAWFAEFPAEYRQAPGQDPRERRFTDALFVHSGPVLARIFGPGPAFADCAALFDGAGRLTAWRDWRGETHPAQDAGAGPNAANAAQAARP